MTDPNTPPVKMRVRVDPDIQDLIPGYLENRESDVKAYKLALEQDDFKKIAELGHLMRGSGGGYGFNDLSSIGHAIEKAAKNRDKESVRKSIIDLTDFLDKLEIIYD